MTRFSERCNRGRAGPINVGWESRGGFMPRATWLRCVSIMTVAVLAGGCATMFSSSAQTISFSSNPQGSEVLLDGRPVGVTPVSTRIERESFKTRIVTIRHAGYQPAQFQLLKTLNTVVIL